MSDDGTADRAIDEGTVYLLHFSQRVGNACHYTGWTKTLEDRLAAHRAGKGGRATKVLVGRGQSFDLVRTWSGGQALEGRIKRRGPKQFCPICNARPGIVS